MSVADVNDKNHSNLQNEVLGYLRDRQFILSSVAYHDTHHHSFTRFVQNIFSPTAMFYRSFADRWAFHEKVQFCFDAKTAVEPGRRSGRDMCIEARPLATHVIHAKMLGVLCLYCCRDVDGVDRGFWAHDSNGLIRDVWIPRRDPEIDGICRATLLKVFRGKKIKNISWSKGSRDAFIVIDESTVKQMRGWKELIDDAVSVGWKGLGLPMSQVGTGADEVIKFLNQCANSQEKGALEFRDAATWGEFWA